MNLLFLASAIVALQGAQVPQQFMPKAPPTDKVVARVNEFEIKASDVEAFLWDWRGQEVLQDLITYQLLKAEVEKQKIEVPELEVLKVVDDQLTQIKQGAPKDKDLDTALREQGFPRSRLYLRVRADLMLQRLAEKSFDPARFVHVSTMVYRAKSASASDLSQAVMKAEAAYNRLKKGDKWDVVLKATQEDPTIVNSKGLLDWKPVDAFPEPTRIELKNAKPGDLLKPVQTSAGIQFFRVEALGSSLTGDGLAGLKARAIADARLSIIDRLRREAKIERFLGSAQ